MTRRQYSVFCSKQRTLRPLPSFWCRRRDSNSHSLRHYPLKIACLPISPRRHVFFATPARTQSRESHLALLRYVFCLGTRINRSNRRFTTRRSRLRNSLRLYRFLHDTASRFWLTGGNISQGQARGEKHCRENTRGTTQKISRASGTKQAAGSTATKRSPHVGTLAMLHQHQTNNNDRNQNMDRQEEREKPVHLSAYQFAARQIVKKSSATKAAPPIKPPSMSDCPNNSFAFCGFTLPP